MGKENASSKTSVHPIVMRLVVELTVDESFAACKISDDKSERDWFYDELLGDPGLLLHSNLVGETLGSVRIVGIESA